MGNSGLIGVIIGGLIGFVSAVGAKIFDDRRTRRALKVALRAEILGLLAAIEARRHEELAQGLIAVYRAGGQPPNDPTFTAQGFTLDPVFKSNVVAIGTLGAEFAARIVSFYDVLNSLRADFQWVNQTSFKALPNDRKADFLQNELDRWLVSKTDARALCDELARSARSVSERFARITGMLTGTIISSQRRP